MADKRISQLNAHTSPTGSDLLVIVNNNETKKITYADLSAALTGSQTDITALNQFTQSIDSRVDNLESWSSSLNSTFATDLEVSIVSSSVAATIGIISQNTGLLTTSSFNDYTSSQEVLNDTFATTSSLDEFIESQNSLNNIFATTGSNHFRGYQRIDGFVTASSFSGQGRYLTNLSPSTNWNYNQEFTIRKTEKLTFSGDYILEDSYLVIEGGLSASIGEWTEELFTNGPTGSITRNSNNQYTLIGPTGDTNGGNGLQIKRLFDTNTTMSVQYTWNGDGTGNDRPYYDVSVQDPTEPNNASRLRNTSTTSENGVWTINVPSGSWVAIGVWTDNINNTSGSLQITLPYLPNDDIEQYSPNKYFKKEGTIFIGGNLLVKDSYIINNGKISVGGDVILIGNSQIVGTGIII